MTILALVVSQQSHFCFRNIKNLSLKVSILLSWDFKMGVPKAYIGIFLKIKEN